MRRSRSTGWILASVMLFACGGGEEPSRNLADPTPGASPLAASGEAPMEPLEEVPPPSYVAHEWGLVDYVLEDESFEIAAGPGEPQAAPPPPRPHPGPRPPQPTPIRPTPPHINRPHVTRKPVIYFHLEEGDALSVNVRVRVPQTVAEHWPPAERTEDGVQWAGVELRGPGCESPSYPTRTSAACRDAPDGYCELADLPDYVAADAGCLRYRGEDQRFLFYRGAGNNPRLPFRVVRLRGGSVRIENVSMEGARGPMLRLVRDGRRTRVAIAELPTRGSAREIPSPTSDESLDSARAAISGALRAFGLTEGEARAFERAWFEELFEQGPTGGAPLVRDALLFFLPAEDIDGFARLELDPEPRELVRVMAMRIDLGR